MPEQIGVFVLFVVFVVFNLIAGAVKRWRQQQAAAQEAAAQQAAKQLPRAPVVRTLPPRVVVRPPDEEEVPPVAVVTRIATFRPPRRPRRRLELRRSDLRRAIVLMTVLGPPRALEQEGKEGGGQR